MSQEITISARLHADNGNMSIDRNAPTKADMSGTHYSDNIQNVPTTAAGTLVTITSGVGTPGCSMLQNVDAHNYIEIGLQIAGVFYPVFVLYPGYSVPGETLVGRIAAGATLYARANTAAANLMALVLES